MLMSAHPMSANMIPSPITRAATPKASTEVNSEARRNDAFMTVTYDDANEIASSLGWQVKSTAQVSGVIVTDVPEPGSLALISLAMLGLGAVARRRNKQAENNQG